MDLKKIYCFPKLRSKETVSKRQKDKKTMRELSELKKWLEGDGTEAKAWRTDPKNLADVAGFVEDYASQPGGISASVVWDSIHAEQRRIKRAAMEEEKAREKREALLEAVRYDYMENGGLEKDFDARKSSILESYALSGRIREVLGRRESERRSQAARTF